MLIERQILIDAAYEADIEPHGGETEGAYMMFDYSGRCMYGRECIGVIGTIGDAIRLAVEIDRAGIDTTTMGEPSMDDMGRSSIVYWPNVMATADDDALADELVS